jgi:hypothetical protein
MLTGRSPPNVPHLSGDQVRFSWQLGLQGSDGPIKGTDFATLENERLKCVVGFQDQVPAAA